jgi:hypothetical protein
MYQGMSSVFSMRVSVFIVLIAALLGPLFSFTGISRATQEEIPELNRQIIAFVDTKFKKKVGRGECWDLAAEALNQAGAKWDGLLEFGKRVDPETDVIYPGDIIQFEKVQTKYQVGNMKYSASYYHHTAIVYKVLSPGVYQIAEQNTTQHGKKVSLGNFDISTVTKGTATFFRPQK